MADKRKLTAAKQSFFIYFLFFIYFISFAFKNTKKKNTEDMQTLVLRT